MAYADEKTVRAWQEALSSVDIEFKKMFGCICVYVEGRSVGWLSDKTFSIREVGLSYLPSELKRPAPNEKIREISIPFEYRNSEWLSRALVDTARIIKEQRIGKNKK